MLLESVVIHDLKILLFAALLLGLLIALRLLFKRPAGHHRPAPRAAQMSRAEALGILGLEDIQADEAAVIDAHRRLMQKLHPDKGGSAHLARQLNEAKRVLLQKP